MTDDDKRAYHALRGKELTAYLRLENSSRYLVGIVHEGGTMYTLEIMFYLKTHREVEEHVDLAVAADLRTSRA